MTSLIPLCQVGCSKCNDQKYSVFCGAPLGQPCNRPDFDKNLMTVFPAIKIYTKFDDIIPSNENLHSRILIVKEHRLPPA